MLTKHVIEKECADSASSLLAPQALFAVCALNVARLVNFILADDRHK